MKVIITEPAKDYLKELFDFYLLYIPHQKSKSLISKVIKKTRSLETLASRGSIEENLIDTNYEYRYILQDNCKIIYRIEDDIILVTDFFDVRQDPSKLIYRRS